MRFSVELLLEGEKIPKEKNRLITHIFKLLFEKNDRDMYRDMYEDGQNKTKDFTFSTYLGKNIEFLKEEIRIPDRKIIVNWSSYSAREGLLFYNSFIENLGLEIPIKNNTITITRLNQVRTEAIMEEEILVVAKSPICIQEHREKDNSKTWYHSISSEEGFKIFKENLIYQIENRFPKINKSDLEDLKIEVIKNKEVKVKHYGIVIPSNLSTLRLEGKTYILDYLYQAGIGSRRAQGFGNVDLLS